MSKYKDPATGMVSEIGNPEINTALTAGKVLVPDTTPLGAGIPTPTPTTQNERNMAAAGLTPEQMAGVRTGTGYDPTIAGSGVRRYTGATGAPNDPYSTAAAAYYGPGGLGAPTPPVDEATIRAQMLTNVQAQTDAIKNTYAGLISTEKIAGEGRLGATRAVGARSGTLGQDFGLAEMEKTRGFTAENIKALENDRDLKIQGILSKVNEDAYARAQTNISTAQKQSVDYLNYLKTNQDSVRSDVNTLAKSGLPLDQLSDAEYNKLIEGSGYTPEQMKAIFTINKPQDQVLTSFTQGNQYIVVTQDPITKQRKTEKVDLGFTVPTEWKDSKLEDGSILFYDPKNPKNQQIYNPAGGPSLDQQKKQLEIQKLKKDLSASGDLTPTDVKNLKANGISEDVARGIYKDASNGYSDQSIQDNLTKTFGDALGKQYWTAFTTTMRKSQTASAALLSALGISGS